MINERMTEREWVQRRNESPWAAGFHPRLGWLRLVTAWHPALHDTRRADEDIGTTLRHHFETGSARTRTGNERFEASPFIQLAYGAVKDREG